MRNLLTLGDAKTSKGEKLGYKTAILYMSPHKQNSTGKNLCAFATVGCAAACLFTAGRGKFSNVKLARIKKADYFLSDQKSFLVSLIDQITSLSKKYPKNLVIRLNGTTDIPFEELRINDYNIFELFPDIQFYDYTKNPRRFYSNRWSNYHLTFSRAESDNNKQWSKVVLRDGFNVAIVFEKELHAKLTACKGQKIQVGDEWFKVVNGDESDLRFLDDENVVVALKAKGDANKDSSGFVVRNLTELI
jgi:hypothetical protein